MKKHLLLLACLCFTSITWGQQSLNMSMLGTYDDNTLPSTNNNDDQRVFNDIWGYAAADREYAFMGSASYVHFFDVTDPTQPILIDQIAGGDTTVWRDMKVYENYLYAVSDATSEGLLIFDLSDLPNSVSLVRQTTDFFLNSHNIFIDVPNGRLYSAGTNTQNNGLVVLDIATDPANPTLLANASLDPGNYVHDVYVRDNIAYCSHGNSGYYIWDFETADAPVLLASASTNGYNHSSWVSEDGSFALFAEEVPRGLPLGIMDLTSMAMGDITVDNFFKFQLLTDDSVGSTPHNPFILGDRAFISYYEDGVQVYDLSDPSNPVVIGYYDTFPNNTNYAGYFGCWGVYPYLPSGTILASDRKYGLFLLQFEEPTSTNELEENNISIFPNPSQGIFQIKMDKPLSETYQFEIFNLAGQLIQSYTLQDTQEEINLSFLADGFYLGKIKMGGSEMIQKLVISK